MKDAIQLKWSKREKDWIFHWPDNQGSSLKGVFFEMIKTSGHRVDFEQDLIKMLDERGYDYTTLKITCKKKKDEKTD